MSVVKVGSFNYRSTKRSAPFHWQFPIYFATSLHSKALITAQRGFLLVQQGMIQRSIVGKLGCRQASAWEVNENQMRRLFAVGETDEIDSRIRDSFCRTDSSLIVSFDSSVIADVWRLGVGICIRLITTRCHLIFYAQSIRNKSYVIRDTATLNDSISLVRVPLSSGFSNKKWRWMCGCVCVF